ncbi:lysine transporter LysE [Aliidiomarina soli]|uniref:Lysine transporter LysE n=2 Tax=Aliidiomarina soli TaxID=1928574 RepID=A0A432WN40_9GAMM|nr:lysine transporter LysE [Aliidiomarina soli]
MSPGPDFAVVSRYAVRYGIRLGCIIAIGVGTGILVHIAYSLLGVALVIHRTPWLYQALLLAASGYFIWLGWNAMRAPAMTQTIDIEQADRLSAGKAFVLGFITNALNPKATLFFLALFTTLIAPQTPMLVKAGYGLYMALATMAWFCLLALMLGNDWMRRLLLAKGYWFDRVMGAFLWLLAAHLLWQWWQS